MINSTLCYLERGDAYLMLHRVKKKGDLNHDKWIGVGGKFEDGESPEDCILRETWEETGLTLTDYRYRGLVTFVSDETNPSPGKNIKKSLTNDDRLNTLRYLIFLPLRSFE